MGGPGQGAHRAARLLTDTTNIDPPVASFHILYSRFAEAMDAIAGTDAEAAYDIWLSNTRGAPTSSWSG